MHFVKFFMFSNYWAALRCMFCKLGAVYTFASFIPVPSNCYTCDVNVQCSTVL